MNINELFTPLYEQQRSEPFEWNGKQVVWTNGFYYIAVDSVEDPSYLTLWTEDNKRIGQLSTRTLPIKGKWMGVSDVGIEKRHQGEGLGIRLYQQLIWNMNPRWDGLVGYKPDIANKRVYSIYRRLGAVDDGGDHLYVKNPNRA